MPAKALQDLVDFARTHSPFYAELYRDVPPTISHLTQLPLVDQAAFTEANTWPDNRILTGPLVDAGVYKSGGTSGAPKFSPWTRSEHADSVTAFGAGLVQAGLRPASEPRRRACSRDGGENGKSHAENLGLFRRRRSAAWRRQRFARHREQVAL